MSLSSYPNQIPWVECWVAFMGFPHAFFILFPQQARSQHQSPDLNKPTTEYVSSTALFPIAAVLEPWQGAARLSLKARRDKGLPWYPKELPEFDHMKVPEQQHPLPPLAPCPSYPNYVPRPFKSSEFPGTWPPTATHRHSPRCFKFSYQISMLTFPIGRK